MTLVVLLVDELLPLLAPGWITSKLENAQIAQKMKFTLYDLHHVPTCTRLCSSSERGHEHEQDVLGLCAGTKNHVKFAGILADP